MAHTAEHAVDLETGAVVAVTVQGADQGDTTTIQETFLEAAEQMEAVGKEPSLEVVILLEDLQEIGVDLLLSGAKSYGQRGWREPLPMSTTRAVASAGTPEHFLSRRRKPGFQKA